MPPFQPYRGNPAVRNDREGRGNVGIIRSPVRASTLPDGGGPAVKRTSLPPRSRRQGITLLGGAGRGPLRASAGGGGGRSYLRAMARTITSAVPQARKMRRVDGWTMG